MNLEACDVCNATHVKTESGEIKRIRSKWGVNGQTLEPPSKGGFGVVTDDGDHITMWKALAYYKSVEG